MVLCRAPFRCGASKEKREMCGARRVTRSFVFDNWRLAIGSPLPSDYIAPFPAALPPPPLLAVTALTLVHIFHSYLSKPFCRPFLSAVAHAVRGSQSTVILSNPILFLVLPYATARTADCKPFHHVGRLSLTMRVLICDPLSIFSSAPSTWPKLRPCHVQSASSEAVNSQHAPQCTPSAAHRQSDKD